MSKHKKRKHKRVADPHDDYMQKRHAYWAACAKKGELTEEQLTPAVNWRCSSLR